MKLELIEKFSGTAATSGSQEIESRCNIVKGHINQILVVVKDGLKSRNSIENSTISVKHISDRITNLSTAVNMKTFMDISDEKNGSANGGAVGFATLKTAYIQEGGADVMITEGIEACITNKTSAILIDLGSFNLIDGDELDFSIKRKTMSNGEDNALPSLEIYAVSNNDSLPFHFITYDEDADKNELHRNVKELYLLNSNNYSFDIFVDSESSQYQTTVAGVTAYAMLTGRFENSQPSAMKIYENDIPEDVAVKLVGNTHADTSVLCVRVQSNVDKYEAQQRTTLQKKAIVLEKFEKSQPQTASVLQASGMPSSTDLLIKSTEF